MKNKILILIFCLLSLICFGQVSKFEEFFTYHSIPLSYTLVDSRANISLPTEANWNEIVNIRPASNETVFLNPPIFSWFYSPGNPTNMALDQNIYEYHLQIDYTGAFTSPVVDVITPLNFYNYLPILNVGNVYWRVAYMSNSILLTQTNVGLPTTGWVTNSWITNNFTIASNATNWNRSMLTNTTYLTSKGVHPHVLFNSGNLESVAHFVQTNSPNDWYYATNLAYQTINSSWWNNTNEWTNVVSPDPGDWSTDIANVAFVWKITENSTWETGLTANFSREVNYFNSTKLYESDYSSADQYEPWSIALCYDWLYSITPSQTLTNALNTLDQLWLGILWGGPQYQAANGNNDRWPFSGPYTVPSSSFGKLNSSHYYIHSEFLWLTALALYNDHPDAKQYFDMILNYMISQKTPWGSQAAVNSGRGYGFEDTMNNSLLSMIIMAQITFPEAAFNTDPFWSNHADWWMRMMSPGYNEFHEPWGDGNIYYQDTIWSFTTYSDLAAFSKNGSAALAALNEIGLIGESNNGYPNYYYQLPNRYYFPLPLLQTNTSLAVCYPQDGWVFGSTYSPNSTNCFTNGVGFIFMARPSGGWSHGAHNQDLNFEMWAYGANVTDCNGGEGAASGNNYTTGCSWTYNTIAINGLGECVSQDSPDVPIYSEILAFTNAPDYVYCMADGTYTYPHVPWVIVNGNTEPSGWFPTQYQSLLSSGTILSSVTKVQRHILFVHHKYLVVYDDLAATSAKTWEWVYHVKNNTVTNVSPGTFSYSSTVMTDNQGNVGTANQIAVYVFQVVNSSLLNSVNMSGINAYNNPVTGENYWSEIEGDSSLYPNSLTTNSIWVNNITPSTNFHFMTVIYPVSPNDTTPTITRLDDYTVAVTNGIQGDVISFNPSTTNKYSILVNSPFMW